MAAGTQKASIPRRQGPVCKLLYSLCLLLPVLIHFAKLRVNVGKHYTKVWILGDSSLMATKATAYLAIRRRAVPKSSTWLFPLQYCLAYRPRNKYGSSANHQGCLFQGNDLWMSPWTQCTLWVGPRLSNREGSQVLMSTHTLLQIIFEMFGYSPLANIQLTE